MDRRRTAAVTTTALALASLVAVATPALSDQVPATCTSNAPALNVSRDRTLVRNGDVVSNVVEVSDLSTSQAPACNITNATVPITLPAPDGTPDELESVTVSVTAPPQVPPPTPMTEVLGQLLFPASLPRTG